MPIRVVWEGVINLPQYMWVDLFRDTPIVHIPWFIPGGGHMLEFLGRAILVCISIGIGFCIGEVFFNQEDIKLRKENEDKKDN